MADGLTSEVSAGASPAAESSSPGSASPDLGGSNGAPTGGSPAPESTPAPAQPQPAVAANENGSDAAIGAGQDFITDEELAQVPDQWRSRFDSLRTGYKSLEQDHKAYKSLGDVETLQSTLGLLDGLYGTATDDNGNTRYDQETGLPMPSTEGFVSQLAESSPAMVDQLLMDIAKHTRTDGRSYAAHFFQSLGLNVEDIDRYAELSQNPNNVTSSSGVITADELAAVPESFHDTYKSLSAEDRLLCQQMPDDQLNRFLKAAQSEQRLNQFEERYTKDQEDRSKAESTAFWSGVKQKQGEFRGKLWSDGLNSIRGDLASKVQFSSDPVTQSVQETATMAIVSLIADPNHTGLAGNLLEQLGINLDPSFMQSLQAIASHADEFVSLQEIAGNPKMVERRNDSQMRRAQGEMDSKYRSSMAKFNEIALAVAKAIAGGNQQLREATTEQLNGARTRPTLGGARPPGNGAGKNPYNPKTQTNEWFAYQKANRQQSGQ